MSHKGWNNGYQLPVAPSFITILCECNLSSPAYFWNQYKALIYNDLYHQLHFHHIHDDPTKQDIFDYSLYLIDKLLSSSNMSIKNQPNMSQVQKNWGTVVGHSLISEQWSYDLEEQAQLRTEHIHTLNPDQ